MNWLEIKNLTFGFPNQPKIFQNFSLSLEKCGIYSFHGDSGVGKSTLSLLLAGHLKADEGTIYLNGKELKVASKKVFYVSQDEDLFPWQTVEEQLAFFLQFRAKELDVSEALRWVELDGARKKFPAELSGGMRKRLSLLRASVFQPELLILDETLASIEVDLRVKILNTLSKYWESKSTGTILISHDKIPKGDFPILGEIEI
jgi:ABC-type nitrate/sulfonate/bicarbonate transport system ATPase subunit